MNDMIMYRITTECKNRALLVEGWKVRPLISHLVLVEKPTSLSSARELKQMTPWITCWMRRALLTSLGRGMLLSWEFILQEGEDTVLVEKPCGRLMCRWELNIKVDVEEMGWESEPDSFGSE